MSRRRGRTMGSAALAVAALLTTLLASSSGCSLRYDFSVCEEDGDCARFEAGAPGVVYRCEASQCVVDESVECRGSDDCTDPARPVCEATRCVADSGGTADMEPTEDMGDTSVNPDMPPDADQGPSLACSASSQCVERFGDGWICRASSCVEATSEACQQVYYYRDGERDRVVFVGSIFPLSPPYGEVLGEPLRRSMQLAIDMFNEAGGLPDGRKIAWVSCDDRGDPAVAREAAKHLVEVVGVPAIVGPLFSDAFQSVATNVAIPKGVFAITPTATSTAITSLNDNDLIWRNITSDLYQGEALVERLRMLGSKKVIVFAKDDVYGKGLQAIIQQGLINLLGASNVHFELYQDPTTFGVDEMARRASYGALVQEAVTADLPEADALVFLGTNEAVELAAAYLTVHRQIAPMGLPAKMIFSHGAIPALTPFMNAILAESMSRGEGLLMADLIEGVAPDIFDPASSRYQNYAIAYNTTFDGKDPILASTTTFDATMVVLMGYTVAASSSGQGKITGLEVAKAMEQLNDKDNGQRIEFFKGPWIQQAKMELSAGRGVDVLGVSGEMDFDPGTGDVIDSIIRWHVTRDGLGAVTIVPRAYFTPARPPAPTGSWVMVE